jgi:hypothetical protein
MRTIQITSEVKNPEVLAEIRSIKAKKQKVQELIMAGVHPSEILEDLKVRLKK